MKRIRDGKSDYPQIYEMRRDHDDAIILQAVRESEVSCVRIYANGNQACEGILMTERLHFSLN